MAEQEQTNHPEPPNKETARRNVNGPLIFSVFAIIIFAVTYKPSVDAIYCNAETLSPKPDVVMLGATWCPYCYKARKYFIDNEISYCEYDIEDNGKGTQMYSQINNRSTNYGLQPLGIPILFIDDQKFSGFDEHTIEKLFSGNKPL